MVGVKQAISDVNFLPSARLVYLLDENDVVISSGQLELVGVPAAEVKHAVAPMLLKQVRSKMSGEIVLAENRAFLLAIYPVLMARKLGEFRSSRIGVVIVEFDLTTHLASLQSSVLRSISKSAFIIILFIVFGGICMHFILTRRVSRILDSAKEYMSGNRAVRVNLAGADELASIAKAFDDVVESVKVAENEILIRQGSLNNAQRIAHLGNWEWEIASGNLFWSDEMFRIFGYEPQAFATTYEAFINAIHPDDQDLVHDTVEQALGDKTAYEVQHRIVRPDGEERVVLEVGEPRLDEAGEPDMISGTVLDITETYKTAQEIKALNATLEQRVEDRTKTLLDEIKERRAAQEKYLRSEDRTRQIVNSAVDGIITINQKGIVETYNTAAEKMFGYSLVEVVGKNVSMLMPAHDASQHDQYLENYHQTGHQKIIGIGREVKGQRKDKSTFDMELSVSEFAFGDDLTFVGIVRDITKRKKSETHLKATLEQLQNTQEGLVEAEKMASLGGLVAGVAHEINTPVGVGLTAATH
ncbi:MAG: PAS domain S-box protein, partial [Magnetovibrio sp.]|nr:PAS domain S-box protein [Magnetovibrio sp.]